MRQCPMKYEIETTTTFRKWFARLKDTRLKARIVTRLHFVRKGHFGDHKTFSGIGELRFDFGSGCRVYYFIRRGKVVILLVGGDKSSQRQDIIKARAIVEKLKGRDNEDKRKGRNTTHQG